MPNKQRKAEQAAARNKGSAKSSTANAATASNSRTQDTKSASKDASKAKGKPGAEPIPTAGDNAKKPDTRTLVSGTASWTGKLPMNLLSEHCQKQKWEKPEYGMRKMPNGFLAWVTLRMVNPKTKEVTELKPLRVPTSSEHIFVQATAAEARHLAATYALFRVASGKNIHMMLPPNIRDVWKELQKVKDTDMAAKKDWLYETDPFKAQAEHQKAINAAQKAREVHAQTSADSLALRNSQSGPWKYAPSVDLGPRRRAQVEHVVRKYTLWNVHKASIPLKQKSVIAAQLVSKGFRKTHVEEAIDQCKDESEALEWLLIHVPEDDLPAWSLPEGYTAGVNLASSNLVREAAIKRLHEAGYSTDLCTAQLDAQNGDEKAAAGALQRGLEEGYTEGLSSSTIEDVWRDEMSVLDATYGDRLRTLDEDACRIELELGGPKLFLNVVKSHKYPEEPPIVAIVGKLPSYIKLAAYRQLLKHCHDLFLGQPMIFSMVDWVEENYTRIVENPGRLQDVVGAVLGAGSVTVNAEPRSNPFSKRRVQVSRVTDQSNSAGMRKALESKKDLSTYQQMARIRQTLPAWGLRAEIVRMVENHRVTIISGETGSGKSTQVVQFILDAMIEGDLGSLVNIVCTQPRRISALGLAQRVSDERCSRVGDEVGYSIRGESKQTLGKTKITFVTTGVLLRRLQSADGYNNALAGISHVIVDEVHERDLDTDFLLVLLKKLLAKRKDLKVLLMSATLDAATFENYFKPAGQVGKIDIPGRTFPVTDHYLEEVIEMSNFNDGASRNNKEIIQHLAFKINYDLVIATVSSISAQLEGQTGGILIFLPGVAEINRVIKGLQCLPGLVSFPLHASLTSAEQRRVFLPVRAGQRKVIAATNVAETSITIDDIVVVIDTGKVKQTSFDASSNMVRLQEAIVSQAAAKQRRGRAGRTRAGDCYKLYTREAESRMVARPEPEILRVPLEQIYLSVRAMGVKNVLEFLQSALTAPTLTAIEGAKTQLLVMGALDGEDLTALGYHLSRIPADIRLAKLMIYGALFSCLDRCITIASILTSRSPFVSPQESREQSKAMRNQFSGDQGDLIGDMRAFEEWADKNKTSTSSEIKRWCLENFLADQTLRDISSNRTQYISSLQEIGFVQSGYKFDSLDCISLNTNKHNTTLLRAIIAGAFYPQIARIQMPAAKYAETVSGAMEQEPEARTIKYFTKDAGRVFVHPSSTLFDAQSFVNNSTYLSYFTKMATAKTFVRDLSPFSMYALLLFGGRIMLDTKERGLVMDDWIRLRGWPRIGVLISRLRSILDRALESRIDNPYESGNTEEMSEVLDAVVRLLEYDGQDR